MNINLVTKIFLGAAIALGATTAIAEPSYACHEQEGDCVPKQEEPCEAPCAAEPVKVESIEVEEVEEPCGAPCAVEPIEQECYPQAEEGCGHPVMARPIFSCEVNSGTPTTIVDTPGGRFPIVRWVSHHFASSGYDPYVRCQQVSARFQRYSDDGLLNYITTGMMNGQPVVCVSGYAGGPCQGLLFTLKRGQDSSRVVQQLFDIPARAAGPLYESGSRFYLDMQQYLGSL